MPQRDTSLVNTAQLGLIVEDAASEIFLFSATTFKFLLVNRGARENLGYGFEELRDLTPWDIKPELNEHQFKEKVRPLLESGSGDIVFETVHQRKDGSLYDVSVHLQLIPQDEDSIFFAAIRDVTRENELKRVLEQREKELEEALAARETLLQEVNHRVKNSLQVVTALLQLHARQVTDDHLKAALADAKNRVAVVASIHQRLYMSGEHSMVDIGEFLDELATATIASMSLGEKVKTDLDLETGVALGIDRAVPLALVVSELLTNSLKYAFPDGRSGTVGMTLRSINNKLELRVFDDGVGFSPFTMVGEGTGLGSRIVEALGRQIRAQVETVSDERGTSTVLSLPLA